MDLRRFLQATRRQAWLVVEVVAVLAVAAMALSTRQSDVYRATSRVAVRADATGAAGPVEPAAEPSAGPAVDKDVAARFVSGEVERVRSEPVAALAAARLKGSVSELRSRISVASRRGTDQIAISATGGTASSARRLADAWASAYLTDRHDAAVSSISATVDDLGARLDDLQHRNRDLDATLAAVPPGAPPPSDAIASRDAATHQYDALFGRSQQLLVERSVTDGGARLVQGAETPGARISPHPVRNLVLGAGAGLLLGLGLATLRERLDDRVRSRREVEEATGMPVLAELPFDPEAEQSRSSLAIVREPTGPLAEHIRGLRTSLELLGADDPIRVLVVTSPEPGDGKSLVAANLACACAEAGHRTMLVSADLRRPSLEALLGPYVPEGEPGLEWVGRLSGVTRLPVTQTSVPNLMFLPAGPASTNPAELLVGRRAGEVLAELSAVADVLILDTPPVMAVADAVVLAGQADGVLVVACVGTTRREALRATAATLDNPRIRRLGVVVNKVRGADDRYREYYRTTPRPPLPTGPLARVLAR